MLTNINADLICENPSETNQTKSQMKLLPKINLDGFGVDGEDSLKPEDNRIVGEKNEMQILNWIYRFGWLSTRMIAALVWPTASQSWAMARRTIKKMHVEKLIITRALSQGGEVYLLSVKGAGLLKEILGVQAKSGQSLATGNTIHRACSNWYLINELQKGNQIYTEHELASGLAPIKTLNGKLFDGLVVHDDGLITACEVENTWKNRSRRQAIVDVCTRYLGNEKFQNIGADASGQLLYFARLAVIGTSVEALRSLAATFQESYRMKVATEMSLAAVDLYMLPITPSLVPGEQASGNLWWDVISQSEFQ